MINHRKVWVKPDFNRRVRSYIYITNLDVANIYYGEVQLRANQKKLSFSLIQQ